MKCPNLPAEYLPPLDAERIERWLEDLRLRLSKIEKRSPWDHKFVRRLLAEKANGRLRLTSNGAERVRMLHIRFVWMPTVKAAEKKRRQEAKHANTTTHPEEAA